MKNIQKKIIVLLILVVPFASCNDNYDEINTDASRPGSVNPLFQLNQALVSVSPNRENVDYEYGIVRQIVTPFRGVLEGANTNSRNPGSNGRNWGTFYPNVIKNLVDGISALEGTSDRPNTLSALRIFKAYSFMVITDTYGDVPYSQAGQGFTAQVEFPSYDSQEDIYDDIISELQSASAALTASGDDISPEGLFNGDITKWKRFGNSLLLRAAMRLSKVDAATAQSVVSGISQADLMQSNDDNAFVPHTAAYANGLGETFNSLEKSNYYLDKYFVDHLQAENDPRLEKIAVRYVGAATGADQTLDIADSDPSIQYGLEVGFDQGGAATYIADNTLPLASLYDFSQVNRSTVGSQTAPGYIVTYAQTMLLLAEARERGWATGDPAEAYEAGIRAHMEQFSQYPGGSAVTSGDIDAYITAHTYAGSTAGIEQINAEYWVASFLVGYEAWANFRRSDFPNITPNPLNGELNGQEDFIRRMVYPDGERTVNLDNLNAAITAQGADELYTRVWWDN
ncbi:MAG: SusD/RagB family nutrient-binding outer membrane lipoprotein [Cyclobacteriaceae bacterium]